MSGIGARLREERERIDLSQAAFGAIGGVKANAQGKYESGERSPGADYLAAVAEHGVDVLYVVTGERKPTQANSISGDEAQVLSDYRTLPPNDKASVQRLTSVLAESVGRYDVKKQQ